MPAIASIRWVIGFAAGFALGGWLRAGPADQAAELYRTHRYPEARAAFEQLAAAEPANSEAAYYLGLLALRRDDPEEAVRWLERATTQAPGTARYFRALGDAYGVSAQQAGLFSKLGLARKCGAAYEQAIRLDPEDLEARYDLFTFARQAPAIAGGGLEKARAQALEIRSRNPLQGGTALAELSVAEKQFDAAFAILEDLRRAHPNAPVVDYQLGRTAAMGGLHLDEGAAALRRYLARAPEESDPPLWAAHWRLGQICQRQGALAAAQVEFEAGLKLNPTQPQLLEALRRVRPAAAEAPAPP